MIFKKTFRYLLKPNQVQKQKLYNFSEGCRWLYNWGLERKKKAYEEEGRTLSKNWRGNPLISRETVVNLIGSTQTQTGLRVMAVLDENEYEKGKEVTEEEMSTLNIKGESFHPEWNYTIFPQIV